MRRGPASKLSVVTRASSSLSLLSALFFSCCFFFLAAASLAAAAAAAAAVYDEGCGAPALFTAAVLAAAAAAFSWVEGARRARLHAEASSPLSLSLARGPNPAKPHGSQPGAQSYPPSAPVCIYITLSKVPGKLIPRFAYARKGPHSRAARSSRVRGVFI